MTEWLSRAYALAKDPRTLCDRQPTDRRFAQLQRVAPHTDVSVLGRMGDVSWPASGPTKRRRQPNCSKPEIVAVVLL